MISKKLVFPAEEAPLLLGMKAGHPGASLRSSRRDVVVVGGGHNGLVAAAYLARDGLRRAGLRAAGGGRRRRGERAPVRPGLHGDLAVLRGLAAAAGLVADLQLARHGYHVYPQGPYFAPRADGSYLRLPDDPARPARGDREVLRRRRRGLPGLRGAAAGDRAGARADADGDPGAAGLPAAGRPARQGMLLRHLRKLDVRGTVDVTRLLTGSIADLLDPTSSRTRCAGCCRCPGDRRLGRAAVGRHRLPDAAPPHRRRRDGQAGAWGFPRGGMGGVTSALARGAARSARRSAPAPRWPGSASPAAR